MRSILFPLSYATVEFENRNFSTKERERSRRRAGARSLIVSALSSCFFAWLCVEIPVLNRNTVQAQQSQNPSPMVEHTRAHPRLKEETPPGRREKLELGTLF